MADVFSIVGSAVGVVSLGIKVCEDLVTFTGHVKHMRTEVSQISNHLSQLEDILEELQSIVNSVQQTIGRAPSSADDAIVACSTALSDLSQRLSSPSPDAKSDNVMNRVRDWKKRLVYPFKRDDLLFLKDIVDSLQRNLIVALHALQL